MLLFYNLFEYYLQKTLCFLILSIRSPKVGWVLYFPLYLLYIIVLKLSNWIYCLTILFKSTSISDTNSKNFFFRFLIPSKIKLNLWWLSSNKAIQDLVIIHLLTTFYHKTQILYLHNYCTHSILSFYTYALSFRISLFQFFLDCFENGSKSGNFLF